MIFIDYEEYRDPAAPPPFTIPDSIKRDWNDRSIHSAEAGGLRFIQIYQISIVPDDPHCVGMGRRAVCFKNGISKHRARPVIDALLQWKSCQSGFSEHNSYLSSFHSGSAACSGCLSPLRPLIILRTFRHSALSRTQTKQSSLLSWR